MISATARLPRAAPTQTSVGILDAHLALVQASELQWPEVDAPDAVVDLLQPHVLADAHAGDVDPGALLPANAAVGAHVAHLESIGVLERRELRRHLPRR